MVNSIAPKVFISHASEDKGRFVVEFATKLRKSGIDVWLDHWEMLPGDSLVEKIFEEGLKNADAVIIILSANSVSKPWITEELNASIVSRISNGTKIIPVVIDSCNVPEALKTTLWIRVDNTSNYQNELQKIIAAVFDLREKPTLGKPPEFVRNKLLSNNELSVVDALVLERSATFDLENNSYVIEPEIVFNDLSNQDLTKEQITESLEVLDSTGYLKVSYYMGGGQESYGCRYQLTSFGFESYCQSRVKGYEELKIACAGYIVNENVDNSDALVQKTGAKIRLVNHILGLFQGLGLINTHVYIGGKVRIQHVSAKFKRMLA